MIDPKDFIPDPEGRTNHYIHPELGVCALREGMTLEEFLSELEAGQARERLRLAPGRTMPTEEEIAAGPMAVRRKVDRLLIVKRLDVAGKLAAAEAAMLETDPLTRQRWNMATGGVYADDPDTIDFLKTIGADPSVILAEE